MVKPKIACYITGGWTECGYMTGFLGKINDKYNYVQRFPEKNIGKKGKSKKIMKINGTTGQLLIKKVYEDLESHKEDFSDVHAILIEDDLDDRYFVQGECVRNYIEIDSRSDEIRRNIRNLLGRNIPVFFLYALPEIEAWFLADWNNTFGAEYRDKLGIINSYFSITFRNFVMKNILTDRYQMPNIENYGFFDGAYRKISDELIDAFKRYSYQADSVKNNALYNKIINQHISDNMLRYSKSEEGRNMLYRLSPEKVAQGCSLYFVRTYNELKKFCT